MFDQERGEQLGVEAKGGGKEVNKPPGSSWKTKKSESLTTID